MKFHKSHEMPLGRLDGACACVDYIGCMKNGEIYTSAQYRWFEPQHQLLGSGHYFTHAWGPIYVLSWRIAGEISRLNPNSLRFFNNEGTVKALSASLYRHADDDDDNHDNDDGGGGGGGSGGESQSVQGLGVCMHCLRGYAT